MKLKIALAQINPTVRDLDNNAGKIVQYIEPKALGAGRRMPITNKYDG
ncbi:MAG: hypothetical protein V3V63_04590 [Candidatus Hydrothermarchaeaceae archaeon]